MATLTDNALKEVYNHVRPVAPATVVVVVAVVATCCVPSLLQNRMMKMVRKHLSGKYVLLEEDMLERIAESSEKGKVQHWVKGCQNDFLFLCVFSDNDAEESSKSNAQRKEEISTRQIQSVLCDQYRV